MARIVGVDIPDSRKVWFGLTKIYGIGQVNVLSLIEKSGVDGEKRVKELTDKDIAAIQKALEEHFNIEGDLRREIQDNIKRLKAAGSYRGLRHTQGLPARGQRTRSNARTKRGKRKTIGAMRKEVAQKMESK
ncbi:30S ribosomal protein S13 [Candidatus Roizmanbacteria bacterium CG22_combo_CG10-13_8_21_14_all_38_20]|uniref:Small ribosomal subunit protein uS13 n=1 Tax=Candidatus Roizmanbacteria bacterium CG22_combo_CG10-13_8_21_14_all_38_20 TaxID=1974862 RepID=A0A2H0BWQ8_9BACT|nr:30S ribosomal protein S13 [Candidatus Microgenomates bacterium]PIP62123.1 MAG: 30S ribosomal protein S13 [Candidatus Roizmanbacteria bacterium CG22_combo_CG10-13_8_21_14_all_38_20]PJC31849.1 MAG: 30S ribosomal protein S13 [Candidatus Roizmanbacteria bacterium CG_4_9_14_0_2_um_filter_38_17]